MFNSSCALGRELSLFDDNKNFLSFIENDLDRLITRIKNFYINYNKKIEVTETIPIVSHHMWFTNPSSPREIREEDLSNLMNKIKLLDDQNNQNWKHIFWTNCISCIPNTKANLLELNIDIKEVKDIDTDNEVTSIINNLVSKNYFGIAADLARYFVLNKMGGLYSDLNYVIVNNPYNLMQEVSFFCDNLPYDQGSTTENALIASKAQHPIIMDAQRYTISTLNKVFERNLDGCTHDQLTNIVSFETYQMSIFKNFNKENNKDVILNSFKDLENNQIDHDYKCFKDDQEENMTEQIELQEENFGKCYDFVVGYDNLSNGRTWINEDKQLMTNTNPYEKFVFNPLEILQIEGITFDQLTDYIQRYKNIDAKEQKDLIIPTTSHHIWLTHHDNPKELRPQDLELFKNLIDKLDQDYNNWNHILWTNCVSCLPHTKQNLNSTNINIRDLTDVKNDLISYDTVMLLANEKKFGMASDLLRFDLLKTFGGFYTDINYILDHSPITYMHSYDFFTHTDRGDILVDVYMIAAKPNHPIFKEALAITLRNFNNPPIYVQKALKEANFHIQDLTGVMTYLPYNIAFFRHMNVNTKDFAFPLEIQDEYPKDAKKPGFDFNDIELELSSSNQMSNSEDNILLRQLINFHSNQICMGRILGFDSNDGNSWFDGESLYND